MNPAPIGRIVVAGSGLTAWSVAAALRRRIQALEVTVVETGLAPDALAERMISTLPSIKGFHADIGLTDEDTIVRAASGLRLGSLFSGWALDLPDYVHAYGPYGTSVGGAAFHQLWLRERRNSALRPFDRYSPAAEMARAGAVPNDPGGGIQVGLNLTLARYCEMIRTYALHLGVKRDASAMTGVNLRSSDGLIESVQLAGGGKIEADLFIDCSGPAAMLRSALKTNFVDWSSCLLCDRIALQSGAAIPDAERMERVTASPNGWQWVASSPDRSLSGRAYSSDDSGARELEQELTDSGFEIVKLRQGRLSDFWVGNCVAIGDAATAIEPLEWTNLHLVHSQIDRLVTMMPAADCARVELGEFNRQCAAEADRVRDFICLHYVCSRRPEAFWKRASSVSPPDSLAHTLMLFKERGRLPYYEEETFSRDSWLAVLLGQGVEPRGVDPLADLVSPTEAARAFTAINQSLSSFTLPAGATPTELNPHGIR